jgi:hypothetical protein
VLAIRVDLVLNFQIIDNEKLIITSTHLVKQFARPSMMMFDRGRTAVVFHIAGIVKIVHQWLKHTEAKKQPKYSLFTSTEQINRHTYNYCYLSRFSLCSLRLSTKKGEDKVCFFLHFNILFRPFLQLRINI